MTRSRILTLAVLVLMLSLMGFGCAKKAGGPGDGSGTSWEDQEKARLEQERALREKMGQAANELAQMIHFAFNSSNLTAESRQILTRKAEIMRQYPQIKVIVEGNCDQRGTAEYNLALGERRAQASAQYLAKLGIPADRLSTVSYGKERPLDPATTEAAYAQNRRDEFRATY
ncbi:peptidoglycan-associated lipoprotein Pal [Solidesulfovibrio sp. C21]|uniref:peptidoglycan-associated lipoprotein Pal n=1 Tax=Solidesulfovibrio sp. C21 TaxID=3398613 RepID=UPI0039FBC7DB